MTTRPVLTTLAAALVVVACACGAGTTRPSFEPSVTTRAEPSPSASSAKEGPLPPGLGGPSQAEIAAAKGWVGRYTYQAGNNGIFDDFEVIVTMPKQQLVCEVFLRNAQAYFHGFADAEGVSTKALALRYSHAAPDSVSPVDEGRVLLTLAKKDDGSIWIRFGELVSNLSVDEARAERKSP